MYSMELVVERGQARCPRCVAVADYAFVELGPELLRYEVSCRGCGEQYREKLGPVPQPAGVLATVDVWPPVPPPPPVPVRERLQVWVESARGATITAWERRSAWASALLERIPRDAGSKVG